MINTELIQKFRNKVNGDSWFTLHNYKNKHGKNHWNLICSCMDWIEVAMDYISHQSYHNHTPSLEFVGENINTKCILAYAYISAIDIVWESVQQLQRAIMGDNSILFKGGKGIFNDYSICNDDNEYFTHIRAVFGAHPVNLNKGGKWFASWPTDHVYTEFDYAVTLYNADVEGENMVFGFRFNELNGFLESRYEYLNVLLKELDSQYAKYKAEKAEKKIEETDDEVKQLNILRKAAEERLDSDYYSIIIEDLLTVFQAPCTINSNKGIVELFLSKCKKIISEVATCLQTMEFEEIKSGWILNYRHPNEIHYELSKLYECLYGTKDDIMYNYHLEKVSQFLKKYVNINLEMEKREIFLLIKAGLYAYWAEHGV